MVVRTIQVGTNEIAYLSTMTDMPSRMQSWTPSDTIDLPDGVRGVMVDNEGFVSFAFNDGSVDTVRLAASAYYGILMPKRILATGTTASGIHLLF